MTKRSILLATPRIKSALEYMFKMNFKDIEVLLQKEVDREVKPIISGRMNARYSGNDKEEINRRVEEIAEAMVDVFARLKSLRIRIGDQQVMSNPFDPFGDPALGAKEQRVFDELVEEFGAAIVRHEEQWRHGDE